MADGVSTRAERYAADFEAAQDAFIRLVESLNDEQWRAVGRNYPARLNEEDETRTVGVIGHHVAVSEPDIVERIKAVGRPSRPAEESLRPVGLTEALQRVRSENAEHAAAHAGVTRDEVARRLRDQQPLIAAVLRGLTEDQLGQSVETPAGPMSVADRIERVLIGHLRMHQGSIESAISRVPDG